MVLVMACGAPAPPPRAAPRPAPAAIPEEDAIELTEVAYAPRWQKTSFGAYLAPERDPAKDGGAIDVMFHFHFGREANDSWRASRLDATIVSVTLGMGSAPYEHALRDPERFERWIDEVLASIAEERRAPPLHLRRLGIASFSAGFGAVGHILASPALYDRLDALVLLDSIHTHYTRGKKPDPSAIAPYVKFASEALARRKVMVLTHSSIVPPDYPSSAETTTTLLDAIGVAKIPHDEVTHGMRRLYRADQGAFHAFGFAGETARDHMEHLALVGDLVREYVARRWTRMALLDARARKEASR
jgi:hypothetical protein